MFWLWQPIAGNAVVRLERERIRCVLVAIHVMISKSACTYQTFVSPSEILYSGNHNFLRTVGFMAVLAAVS